jgi:carbon monoxide dehydrogenase subunit G
MEFDNTFEVPLPPEQAWPVLMDIQRIAPCMPGAQLTEVIDKTTYKGNIGVRLGPVALTFAGIVKFEEIDDVNRTARVKAQGTDAKGRGGANAAASFRLEPTPAGSKVLVHTDLTLSGSVAQYGRGVGMIQATAAQLMKQFAENLKKLIAASTPAATSAAAPAPTNAPAPAASTAPSASPPQAAPQQPLPPAAKPISGFALMARVIWDAIARLFGGGPR